MHKILSKYDSINKWGVCDWKYRDNKERKTPPLMAGQKTTLSAMEFYLKK